MYYLIKETLTVVNKEQIKNKDAQFVAVLTTAEWETEMDSFDMVIDMEPDFSDIHTTKAEVNYDSLTGTFFIPDRNHLSLKSKKFAFALDEKGIVFIDDSGAATAIIEAVTKCKKWRMPSLERFLYDFLEQIVKRDRDLLERYDEELDAMEIAIVTEKDELTSERVNEIRSDMTTSAIFACFPTALTACATQRSPSATTPRSSAIFISPISTSNRTAL